MSAKLGVIKMKFFTKKETLVISLILGFIFVTSFYNFKISLRRSRDAQRKADLGTIANALGAYKSDFGFYPPSLDGKIVACKKEGVETLTNNNQVLGKEIDPLDFFEPCEWGQDALRDVFDPEYPPYLATLPQDPQFDSGASFFYVSNQDNFQVYTALEGKDEDANQSIVAERGLSCGTKTCDFGRSSGAPLEKSLEEYENELLEKKAK